MSLNAQMKAERPLVLLHGWGGSAATDWESTGVAPALREKGYLVTGIDILGHGNAKKPLDPDAYGDLAGDVAAQLPSGPLDAVGFSLGGKLLLELAVRHPALFRRIVVVGVGENVFRPEATAAATIAALDAKAQGMESDDLLANYAISNGNTPASVSACLKRPHNPKISPERLASIQIPVLLIAGAADSVAQSVEPLQSALPTARLMSFEDTGHLALLRHPRLIEAIARFIDASDALAEGAGTRTAGHTAA